MFCSERSTARPSFFSSTIALAICSTITGATPSDGSSSITSQGLPKPAPGDLERPQPRNLFAKKANHAVALRNEPHQRLDRGRLAGAVAAHESHHLAAADVKRRLKQYLRRAVPGLQSVDFEHRRAHW